MVSDVTISSALDSQASTSASSAALADDFSQFLNLLTVQLENQDPLSPMDTTEFTNQLVAFTAVEQQINTNQKLDDLVALELGNSFSAAQNYVGKDISYIASEFDYAGGSSQLRYSLGEEAAYSQINILNESGETIYSTDGSKLAGAHEFIWNGQTNSGSAAPSGTYEISVDALNSEDGIVDTSTVVTGGVRGVETQDGTVYLLVGERAVPVGSVLNTSTATDYSQNNDTLTSALSYVGMEVTYLNDELDYDGSTSINILYNLEEEADRAKLIVYDEDGNTIYTGDVDTDSGDNITSWNGEMSGGGTASAGVYSFKIDAIGDDDNSIIATSQATDTVDGIETINGQIFLNFGNTTAALGNVTSVSVANGGS